MNGYLSRAALVLAVGLGAAMLPACETDQAGVKSNYYSQWTDVSADVEEATEAAEAVLNDLKLTDVDSSATSLDGEASGKMADGTKVTVGVKRVTDTTSEVSAYVGKTGDPELGKDIIARIQQRTAE